MKELSHTEYIAFQKQNSNVLLIDVREEFEHQQHNIGGTNIPLSEFQNRMHEIPKDVPVVLYCRSGGRSAMAAQTLTQSGWTTVYNLQGGVISV